MDFQGCPKLDSSFSFPLRVQKAELLECLHFWPHLNAAVAECTSALPGTGLAHSMLFVYALTHLHVLALSLESPFFWLIFQDSSMLFLLFLPPQRFLGPLLCVSLDGSFNALPGSKLFKGLGKIPYTFLVNPVPSWEPGEKQVLNNQMYSSLS